MSSSPLELKLNERLAERLEGRARQALELLLNDPEIRVLQEYSNVVSIKRLGYNDHGPVHMRKVTFNALSMAFILKDAGVKLSLEQEETGSFEDSLIALLIASFTHDVGMSVGRSLHEHTGVWLILPTVDRLLASLYPQDFSRRILLRSLIVECILGHMATVPVHSRESGILLVADGCDMEKGRARIPMVLNTEARVGDIHKYSAASVDRVQIQAGHRKPLHIHVTMTETVGFFQVEEVLIPKIKASPIRDLLELTAQLEDHDLKTYL